MTTRINETALVHRARGRFVQIAQRIRRPSPTHSQIHDAAAALLSERRDIEADVIANLHSLQHLLEIGRRSNRTPRSRIEQLEDHIILGELAIRRPEWDHVGYEHTAGVARFWEELKSREPERCRGIARRFGIGIYCR